MREGLEQSAPEANVGFLKNLVGLCWSSLGNPLLFPPHRGQVGVKILDKLSWLGWVKIFSFFSRYMPGVKLLDHTVQFLGIWGTSKLFFIVAAVMVLITHTLYTIFILFSCCSLTPYWLVAGIMSLSLAFIKVPDIYSCTAEIQYMFAEWILKNERQWMERGKL